MKRLAILTLALAMMCATGCAKKIHKEWIPVGGSKSDATVKLGYSHTELEIPIVDDSQAQRLAEEKCRTWGYDGAQPFGGKWTQSSMQMYSAATHNVFYEFQCTGGTTTKSEK